MRHENSPGAVIAGTYRLETKLGAGGFGVVWLARELSSNQQVAIKFLKSQADDDARRFEREASTLSQILHPNCVRLFAFVSGVEPFIVTEFVHGQTLDRWAAGRQVTSAEALDVVSQIAAALAATHGQGIIHRDLKPSNVMVTPSGDQGWALKVLDFGLAKLVGHVDVDITKTGEIIGTAGFMSPEQLFGRKSIGPPSDAYCLGLLLFQLLSGRPPFTGDTALELGMKHLTQPAPALPPEVDPRLSKLVARLLRKEPAERPRLDVVRKTLGKVAAGSPPRSDVAVGSSARRENSSSWRGAALFAAVAVAVAAVVGFAFMDGGSADAPERSSLRSKLVPGIVKGPPVLPDEPAEPIEPMEHTTCPGYEQFSPGLTHVRGTVLNYSIAVLVPENYDPHRRYPVVLLFHDGFQTASQAIEALRPGSFADYIVIAPADDNWT